MGKKAQLPFQALLDLITTLSPSEKKKLKQELDNPEKPSATRDDFITYLMNGPVYNEEEIKQIEDNHKSIFAWQTKD